MLKGQKAAPVSNTMDAFVLVRVYEDVIDSGNDYLMCVISWLFKVHKKLLCDCQDVR